MQKLAQMEVLKMFSIFKRKPENCNHKFTISPARFKEPHEFKKWQTRLLKKEPVKGRKRVSIYLYTITCKKCGFTQECEMK